MTIRESAKLATEQMLEAGQSPRTAWHTHACAFLPIVRAHESQGKEMFDPEIVVAYNESVKSRYAQGLIGKSQYHKLTCGVRKLTEMHEHGKLIWKAPQMETWYGFERTWQPFRKNCFNQHIKFANIYHI